MFFKKKIVETPESQAHVNPAPDEIAEIHDAPEGFVTFSKPYHFEGEVYHGIDLSGIGDAPAKVMFDAERTFNKTGNFATLPELNAQYLALFAAQALKMPREFFENLPARDLSKIKNKLVADFFGDGE